MKLLTPFYGKHLWGEKLSGKLFTAAYVLSISEMGHFLNRTLWHNQAALTSSLRPWL